MPYQQTSTYTISVSLPKGVDISAGVPGVNGARDITISATADTQANAAAVLIDGLSQLAAALVAEGFDVTGIAAELVSAANAAPAPTPAPAPVPLVVAEPVPVPVPAPEPVPVVTAEPVPVPTPAPDASATPTPDASATPTPVPTPDASADVQPIGPVAPE